MAWFKFGRKAAARGVRHGSGGILWGRDAPDLASMRRDINHGLSVSVIMAVVQWIQRSIVEPNLELYRETPKGEEVVTEHEVLSLLNQPNPYYSGEHLLSATIFSWVTGGNGHWIKVGPASGGNKPVELWYAPHWMMHPDYPRDGSAFLTGWEYKTNLGGQDFAVDEVVHFRHGIDPQNPRLGISPIHSAVREAWSDMDAGRLVSQQLNNNCIPGLILSPKNDVPLADDPEEVKKDVRAKTRGARRGDPVVFTAPTDVQEFGWSPDKLNLSSVRNVSEERICALLGIHSAVVGFGSGMDQTAVGATMAELRKMSWRNGIVPILEEIAGELDRSLGPDFFRPGEGWKFRFNLDGVEALQEDRGKLVTRVMEQLKGGAITRAKAKELLGHDVDPDDDVYLLPISTMVVPRGRAPEPQDPKSAIPETKQGHDHTAFEERMTSAPRATRIPEQLNALMRELDALRVNLETAMADDLVPIFEDLGRKAESAALEVLDRKDELDTARILDVMALAASSELMAEAYRRHYVRVARVSNEAVSAALGIATDLPDPVARAVTATGGRRAGLVDLTEQSKRRIFDAITDLRAEGAGPPEIARRIRQDVARGPWSDSATRAKVIARTETKFAQNVSTIERAKTEGITQALIFDARLGPTDEVCMALNGRIVTTQEAEQLAIDEHPQGTRSFTPLPPALAEEITP